MATSVPTPRLAASVRLILSMFRLYADIQTDFGRALLQIIKRSFPDQEITIAPGTVGHKLMAIARGQLQNNDSAAMDAIQDFLTYLSIGSQFETDANGKIKTDENGQRVRRKDPKTWNFAKDFKTWEEALKAAYSNLKTQAMTNSFGKTKRDKAERSIDQAYGGRDEGGGSLGDGEGKMPTPDNNSLSQALDDRAAVSEFFEVLDDMIPGLRKTLSPEEDALFGLIFDDEVGTFGSDIKDNMGQASAFEEKLKKGTPEMQAIYEKNAKRWSGFVGDTRKKLLSKIQFFVEKKLPEPRQQVLYDTFFSDTTEGDVDRLEQEKENSKLEYQRGIDLRKLLRLREKASGGNFSDKENVSLKNLEQKLLSQLGGKDQLEEALAKEEKTGGKSKKDEPESMDQVASSIAGSPIRSPMEELALRIAGL